MSWVRRSNNGELCRNLPVPKSAAMSLYSYRWSWRQKRMYFNCKSNHSQISTKSKVPTKFSSPQLVSVYSQSQEHHQVLCWQKVWTLCSPGQFHESELCTNKRLTTTPESETHNLSLNNTGFFTPFKKKGSETTSSFQISHIRRRGCLWRGPHKHITSLICAWFSFTCLHVLPSQFLQPAYTSCFTMNTSFFPGATALPSLLIVSSDTSQNGSKNTRQVYPSYLSRPWAQSRHHQGCGRSSPWALGTTKMTEQQAHS